MVFILIDDIPFKNYVVPKWARDGLKDTLEKASKSDIKPIFLFSRLHEQDEVGIISLDELMKL